MQPGMRNLDRRRFLELTATAAGALALGGCASTEPKPALSSGAETVLPRSAAPRALDFPHFPDHLHTFVWRNWPLVPVARMARVVGATTADIERMGRAMGLGPQLRITADL